MCRRFCLSFRHFQLFDRQALPFLQFRQNLIFQAVIFVFFFDITVIYGSPSGFPDRLAFCRKVFSFDRCLDADLLKFSRRIEHRQKSAYDKIIDLTLLRSHMSQIHVLFCRDNRVMVTDFAVIHKPLVRCKLLSMKSPCQRPVRPGLACLDPFF